MSARTDSPLVSVVIPTFRRPQLLRHAVASVLEQTLTQWELIISDDEDPPAETYKYAEQLAKSDPRIRVVRNPGPHGQVGNANNTFRHAKAPWVKPLYDDDRLLPDCLESMLSAVEGQESVVLVSCLARQFLDGRQTGGDPRRRCPRLELIERLHVHLAMYLQDVDIGIPTSVMVRREILERGAMFVDDPKLVSNVDAYWFARVLEHGDLLCINRELIEQHQGATETVTSQMDENDLYAEFEYLRELLLPMIDRSSRIPSLRSVRGMLRLIRAFRQARQRRWAGALAQAARVWNPRAWALAIRWLLRRSHPWRFATVRRTVLED